jgi:ATP-binding cassette, subfamily C (CFTR/MRP), member 4
VEVTIGSYFRFFLSSKWNYLLLPTTIILFVGSEVIVSFYYRYLGGYDQVVEGSSSLFGNDFIKYWLILALFIVVYFIILVMKYFVINMSLLVASTQAHEQMVESILRSPSSFFDSTPSGILVNKFSNDLGVIDSSLIHGLNDFLEGPCQILSAIVNICQIDPFFMIPAAIISLIAILFFKYARPVITSCKQLDLQHKNPIFHFYAETISGLAQIRVYNRRTVRMQEFSELINRSSKSAIGFDIVARGFGFYETILSIVLMLVGMMMGVSISNPDNSGLYGVAVIYLIAVSERLRWIMKQIILV